MEEEEEMEEVDSDEWEEYEDEPIPVTGKFTQIFLLAVQLSNRQTLSSPPMNS
jgi:hypothetical protein